MDKMTMDDAIAQLYSELKINRDMAIQFAQDSEAIMNKLT